MNFWDIVNRTVTIMQEEEKQPPKFKRYGLMVYSENVMGPGADMQPTMKAVSHFLSDNFQNMDHQDVLSELNGKPDEYYEKWSQYCIKNGIDKMDAVDFGWDWMTSGEGVVTPSNNR